VTAQRRLMVMIGLAFALVVTACSATETPQSNALVEPDIGVAAEQFDRVLDRARRRSASPGLSAAIVHDGVVQWHGQAGFADRTGDRPVRPDTFFSLASVTKSYVAAMTLAVTAERGIDLDDSISGLVPRWVPGSRRVTLRQLLTMTAGYRDVESDGGWVARAWNDPNFPWDRHHMTKLLRRLRAPHFLPGSRYQYSNSNYLLLGLALPKMTGESVAESFNRLVREPLQLRETHFAVDSAVVGQLAHGYERRGGDIVDTFSGARLGYPTDIWGTQWTDGGIEATAVDVARFGDALYGGDLLRRSELKEMTTLGPGRHFGMGMYDTWVRGHRWRGMDGYFGGFTSRTGTDQRRGVTVVVLANGTAGGGGSEDASDAWERLVRAYDSVHPR